MQTALNLHQYLGEVDPLARRYNQILVAFHAAISRKEMVASNDPPTPTRASSETIFNAFFGGHGGVGVGNTTAQPLNAGAASSLDRRRQDSSNLASSANISNANVASGIQAGPDWQPYFQPSSVQSNPLPGALATGGEGSAGMMGAAAGTGISPPDYCLDFDAFFNSVGVGGSESVGQSQDIHAQDLWMPLYGTMDVG